MLLVGWWVYAVFKRLGQLPDLVSTRRARPRRIPSPKRRSGTPGKIARLRRWPGLALGRLPQRSSAAPYGGLAVVLLVLTALVLISTLPPAFALGPAHGAHVTDPNSVQAPSPTSTPTPEPSPSPSDVAAQPTAPTQDAAIVNPPPAPTFQWIPPRPTPPPPPPPTPIDNPPTAILNATPVGGAAPLRVTANASFSWDRDATGIVSYQFNWGDGLTTALQAAPTATHLYNVSGSYRLSVIVVDSAGLWSTGSTIIKVG